MINPNPLKEKRAKLIADAQAILDRTEPLTPEDRTNLDKMHADALAYGGDIERIERQNEMEMKHAPTHQAVIQEDRKAEKRAAFFKAMREGRSGLSKEERALVEDTTGLYMVPEDLEAEIYRGLPQINVIRQLATIRNTSRDKVSKRSMTEVSVGWGKLELGTAITESTIVPSKEYIYAEDLAGLTKVGKDELNDTDANLSALIANSFSVAIANAEAKAFVIGSGHNSSEPEGVAVNTTLLTGIGSSAGAAAVGTYGRNWTTDDTPIFEDLLKLEYDLPAQYRNGASWLMNSKCEAQLRALRGGGYTATDGPFLWQPSLLVGQPNNIDGYPIYNQNDMGYPADTLAKTNVIFGNWKLGYMIVDRAGISIQRLDELYAEAGLVGFIVHFRVGGGVIREDAFRLMSNDT